MEKSGNKILILVTGLLLSALCMKAQFPHDPSDAIKSVNWSIIGQLKINEKSYSEMYPVYSQEMKKHRGKNFALEGYIIPIEKSTNHSRFMLSSLPLNQCYYCGKNGIPVMVLVEMQKPLKYTLKPVKINGILTLENRNMLDGYPILLKKAKHIE